MPPVIHHVLDSSATDAGSLAPSVRGLIERLDERGFPCTWHHALEDHAVSTGDGIHDADVVHVHGCGYPTLLETVRTAQRARKPLILSPTGNLSPAAIRRQPRGVRWRARLRGRRFLRGAALLAQNELEAKRLLESYGHQVHVLPYGIDDPPSGSTASAAVAQPSDRREGRWILMLAPIEPKTGCAALLKAFAEVGSDADGWSVLIAGSDPGGYQAMLQAAVRRKGGENRILFTPAEDEAAQVALLKEASVLVAPSPEPAPATSILLAARAGVPILATRAVVPQELTEVVAACEPNRAGIREGLRRILAMSEKQRRDLAQAAKNVVRKRLHWGVLADRYATLYNSIA